MASSTGEKFVCYGNIDRRTSEVKRSILNDLAILDIQSIDGFEYSALGRKLRDDGELRVGPLAYRGFVPKLAVANYLSSRERGEARRRVVSQLFAPSLIFFHNSNISSSEKH
jgi:hypothetical protein